MGLSHPPQDLCLPSLIPAQAQPAQPPLLVLSALRPWDEQDGGLHPCPGVLGCMRARVPWPRPTLVKVFTAVGFSMKATLWG